MPSRSRRARVKTREGEDRGVVDATNLGIIVRWCAENNGSFTLGKEGGRSKGDGKRRIGPSRWRVIVLDGADSDSLGRLQGRIKFNQAHADISMIVARAARQLEDMTFEELRVLTEAHKRGDYGSVAG